MSKEGPIGGGHGLTVLDIGGTIFYDDGTTSTVTIALPALGAGWYEITLPIGGSANVQASSYMDNPNTDQGGYVPI